MKKILSPFFFNSFVSNYLALVRDARAAPRRLLRSLTSCSFIIFYLITNNAIAESKPAPWAENFQNEVIKNIIKIPSDVLSKKNIKTLDKSIGNNIFHQEGAAKIETKSGDLKIDTKDAESLKQAAEFRKNYKKSAECLEPTSEEISIKCANEYIRARKAEIKQ